MSAKKYLIIVGGPTASGKTALGLFLARHFQTDIISADSRQFYLELDIGTAKPEAEILGQVNHHFINSLSITEEYSVGDFERQALQLLDRLFKKKDVVIVVGGSALFIKALCQGLDEFPDIAPEHRKYFEQLYTEKGISALQLELERADPEYYSRVDLNNPHRLIRALSVCRGSGEPFSSFRTKTPKIRPFTPIFIQLHLPRPVLYERINKRVDQMLEQGLLEEVRQLLSFRHLNALQTIGYQELFPFFDQKISLEAAVSLIKRNSRRYAKRQLTWFRNERQWIPFSPQNTDLILEYIRLVMQENLVFHKYTSEDYSDLLAYYENRGCNSLDTKVTSGIVARKNGVITGGTHISRKGKSSFISNLCLNKDLAQLNHLFYSTLPLLTSEGALFAFGDSRKEELFSEYNYTPVSTNMLPDGIKKILEEEELESVYEFRG